MTSYFASKRPALEILPDVHRYVIALDDNAVIQLRSNGQQVYMTYRTPRGADVALARVLPQLPDAKVVER